VSDVLKSAEASVEALLGAVVDEYIDRVGRGERPDAEEYARRHPQLAAVLRQMLPALGVLHSSAAGGPRPAGPSDRAIEAECPLGDFRIVREIGRGGMGVVYEAVQISLGRCVALKVLPFAAAMDARQLQRFKNEAQAAAHLHHPNIVPVYAVGCDRGVHYYAMQLIEGQTLAALIHDLRRLAGREPECPGGPRGPVTEASAGSGPGRRVPAPGRAADIPPAGTSLPAPAAPWADTHPEALDRSTVHSTRSPAFFRAAAEIGLQAALALEHAHGLGVVHRDVKPANLLVDGRGNLWVTDFGLARVQTDTRLTMTGDLVGTLRYMSPEQALAQGAVDHCSDVYSLGATLYELVTLEPAFNGRDRQELLRQIAQEEPRPPRRVNNVVPAELETIVLKAMAKGPAERYATAGELSDDLRRFLKDEPIRARRPTLVQRVRKWMRRHRAVVWSAAVGLLAALAVLAGSVGWVLRDRAARQARNAAAAGGALEEAQRLRSEGKWPQAQAAARQAEALIRDGADEPALAERIDGLLRELAGEEADGRLLGRIEAIRVLQGEVRNDQFDLQRTLPEYQEAFGDYGLRHGSMTPEEAAARIAARPAAVRGPVLAAMDHWLILARFKHTPEAGWLERVLAVADTDDWRQRVRAARQRNDRQALEQLACEVDVAAQPPETLFLLDVSLHQRRADEAAVAMLRRAQEAFPGDFWINHDLGVSLHNGRPPQPGEAIRFLTAAVAIRPGNAGARLNLGIALLAAGRLEEAVGEFGKAVALKPDYAMARHQLGLALSRQGRLDEAGAALRAAIELKPTSAATHNDLGVVLFGQGRFPEAAAEYGRAIELFPEYAEAHCNLGCALRQQGKFVRSLAAFERGHELGSPRRDWRYPSEDWVREGRRMAELDGRLPAVLRGERQPVDAAERGEYAQVCSCKGYYRTAARLWLECFTDDPGRANDLKAEHRYDAACAAALAAAGRGTDASPHDDGERARWRRQALEWLRADWHQHAKLLEGRKLEHRQLVRERLRQWQRDPDLAGLRDPAAVAGLPDHERQACRQLWADVEALLTRADAAARAARPPDPGD
jgi:serine/threonine protein kinase/Flp pilus assembly protein TadD